MNLPLVTVCITTYNRSNIVYFTIESVIKQTYKNSEIIIVDDCSIDNTYEVIKGFCRKDKRIKYIRHKENKGLAAARNTAINNAKGKYFTFIDDDDEWDNSFIEKFVELAKKYDDSWCFNCGTKRMVKDKTIFIIPTHDGKLIDYIKKGHTPPVAAQFYFTKTLKKVNGYNIKVKSGVDHDLWLRLAFNGIKIKSLQEALSLPNFRVKNVVIERMTTDFKLRLNGIKNSLAIWQPDIEKYLGGKFYKKFYKDYIIYIYKSFIVSNLIKNDIISAVKYLLLVPFKIIFFKKLLVSLIRKIFRKKKDIKIERPLF